MKLPKCLAAASLCVLSVALLHLFPPQEPEATPYAGYALTKIEYFAEAQDGTLTPYKTCTLRYDENWRLTGVCHEGGLRGAQSETFTYDEHGRLRTWQIDDYSPAVWDYDAYGNAVKKTQYDTTVTRDGNVFIEEEPGERVVRVFDLWDTLLYYESAAWNPYLEGDAPHIGYRWQVCRICDEAGNLRREFRVYTNRGRPIRECRTFDAAGRLVALRSNCESHETQLTYDARGNFASCTWVYPDGTRTLESTARYEYDGEGRILTRTCTGGRFESRITLAYDGAGRPVRYSTEGSAALNCYWSWNEMAMSYDDAGNLTEWARDGTVLRYTWEPCDAAPTGTPQRVGVNDLPSYLETILAALRDAPYGYT